MDSIQLTSKEKKFIQTLLDWWEGGLNDTTDEIIDDYSIETPEELNTLVGDIDEQRRTITTIRSKLGGVSS